MCVWEVAGNVIDLPTVVNKVHPVSLDGFQHSPHFPSTSSPNIVIRSGTKRQYNRVFYLGWQTGESKHPSNSVFDTVYLVRRTWVVAGWHIPRFLSKYRTSGDKHWIWVPSGGRDLERNLGRSIPQWSHWSIGHSGSCTEEHNET